MGIFGFSQKVTGAKCCHGNKNKKCHSVSIVMNISGAKFEELCSNISRNILDSVFYCSCRTIYDVITFLICIIRNRQSRTACGYLGFKLVHA